MKIVFLILSMFSCYVHANEDDSRWLRQLLEEEGVVFGTTFYVQDGSIFEVKAGSVVVDNTFVCVGSVSCTITFIGDDVVVENNDYIAEESRHGTTH